MTWNFPASNTELKYIRASIQGDVGVNHDPQALGQGNKTTNSNTHTN
jgi:hypothetical protein